MKKNIFIAVVFCILFLGKVDAQTVYGYDFVSATGTYTEITGGTVVWTGADNAAPNGVLKDRIFYGAAGAETSTTLVSEVAGIPIGFNFTFDNQVANQFAIDSHGLVFLGKDKITANPVNSSMLLSGDTGNGTEYWLDGKINVVGSHITGGIGTDAVGIATTEISYKLEGSGTSHVLTIQFKDLQVFLDNWGDTRKTVSLQIRLYEGSNKVEFIYKDWGANSGNSKSLRVGLKGSLPGYGSVPGSYLIPTDIANVHARTGSWTSTTKGAPTGATITWSNTATIPDGLTFTFTPPSECSEPTAPTALTLTPTSSAVSGNFTASGANRYLVVVSESSTLGATPENGKFYKTGDPVGNGTIVSFKTTTDFSAASEIVGSKDYYFFVFAANTYCASSPKYSTNPLVGTIKTLPAPPTLTFAEEGYTSVKLASVANVSNDQILIASEVGVLAEDSNWNTIADGVFGTPTSALNVGDNITGGGKVVYKGPASDAIVISDLTENTFTHFAAWSFDGTGKFSTTVTKNNVLTWGKVPYEVNFSQFVPYDIPFGWEREGENFRLPSSPNKLECNLNAANASGAYNSITTQWLQLAAGKNKIILDLAITETTGSTGSFVTAPYTDWDEKDSLVFLVSTNGSDYTSVYSIKKANNNTLASGKLYVPIENFGGEKVKIKIGWTTTRQTSLSITGYKVVEKPDCDYPTQYTVSSIGSSSATIQWAPSQGEGLWDIRYRKTGNEWSNPIETPTSSYQLSGLPSGSAIEVQVRAKCSLIDVSPWSETVNFTTKLGLPFSENFNLPNANNQWAPGWSSKKGTIGNPTVFTTDQPIIRGTTTGNMGGNSTRKIVIQYNQVALNDWVFFPVLDFGDGSVNYSLKFDLINAQNLTTLPNDAYLVLVASRDGGATFNATDILNGGNNFTTAGTVSVPLVGYSGAVQFAFYFKSTNPAPSPAVIAAIDNVSITESTPSLVISPSVSDITTSGAKVTWEGTSADWLVFSRKAGETTQNYQSQAAKELVLSSLDPATTYEVGITHSPAPTDTARVVIVPFTTLSTVPCPEVDDIEIAVTPYSVQLSWSTTRDAALYNVHIRPVGYEGGWITKTSTTKSIEIEGLVPNTTYEYEVQAVCSPATGDESAWTTVASFATISASCFAPTALAATPTHKSAVISWEGEADNYELQTKTGLDEWISVSVIGAKTKTLDDLTPETAYSLRIRSLCDDTDISLWSSVYNFTTTAIPPCPLPFNLQATGITDSIAILSWEANEANLSWDLRYREGGAATPVWVNVNNLLVKTYQLDKLTPETPYLWTVKAYCDEDRSTNWVSQETFTTLKHQDTGLNEISGDNLKVFVSNRIINILNPDGKFIEQIQLYDANGQMLKIFTINSSENVLIPLTNTQKTLLVKVNGKKDSSTFKVLVK